MPSKQNTIEEVWGGLASMLVVLPSSIAFGVAIYSALGPEGAGQGAMAGIIGATVLGIIAPILGGTDRLITAPCAPAVAVMGAMALDLVGRGLAPDRIVLLMALTALLSGGLQMVYGFIRGGTLIKYIPFSVVTGYLSGVAVLIFLKQLPGLFGFSKSLSLAEGLASPDLWKVPGLVVGLATIIIMFLAPKITQKVPPAILGVFGGIIAYFGLGAFRPEMMTLDGNPMVIGALQSGGGSFLEGLAARARSMASLEAGDFHLILLPTLTLSVLMSIDTLKTCVIVDAMTRSRHKSNRELIAQGVANISSALTGGMPGAGTSGATLVNLASGGRTRLSSVLNGVFVLAAFLLLSRLIAWTPIATLAGVLIVVAWRMFDKHMFRLLKQKSTVLDFCVIAVVIVVAVKVSLVTASGVGIALTIFLFIRDQIKGSVIRRKTYGNQIFSKQKRLREDMAVLEKKGDQTLVCELQGNLFFGTTDRMFTLLEEDLKTRKYIVLDFQRVQSVDFTGAHMLEQIEARLVESGSVLIFSRIPGDRPGGQNLQSYFSEMGVLKPGGHILAFDQISDALEWVEDQILEKEGLDRAEEQLLDLREIDFLKGRREETIQALEACVDRRTYEAGERIFRQGENGDELFLIRRGLVRIVLNISGKDHHLATFGQGDFFGDMAFLDGGIRSADAVAESKTDLVILSRKRFDKISEEHLRLGQQVFAGLARALAYRLRQADGEIRALGET
ncbi:SLC26A/SulP transporter family protein [bacterium]|nr:SLC26A/SulP transporter family protein [bacterium]